MRDLIHGFVTRPATVVMTILISAVLTYFYGGTGYFAGMIIALTALWSGRFNWLSFGIGRPQWIKTILNAIVLSISIFILIDMLIQPFIEIKFGEIDLQDLDGIKGNVVNYLVFIVFMWVAAAIGEEFLYRGYFMRQFAKITGDTNRAWLISAFVMSFLFGMAHMYQGLSGMIATGLVGLCLSLIFYRNRNNLILAMLVHGFYDMIGITLIFLNKERIIVDWVQTHIIN